MSLEGITFFSSANTSSANKDFYEEWVKDKKPKSLKPYYPVEEIRLTKKGNGYILETAEFNLFFFKKNKLTTQLIEALEIWVTKGNGYELVVVPDEKDITKYHLGSNKRKMTNWFGNGKKYSVYQLPDSDEEETVTNAFL